MTSNNWTRYKERPQAVVNYFQNLYLCDLKQPYFGIAVFGVSCELLSKFVSLWFPTTQCNPYPHYRVLWITFKICIFVISNNSSVMLRALASVVNYFQNLYLCDFQQWAAVEWMCQFRCELLSKFVSLWFETTERTLHIPFFVLWITFKICIFVTSNNYYAIYKEFYEVVNYFSKFVSLWLPTTIYLETIFFVMLWITFKICIFVTSNNNNKNKIIMLVVVNYFQNLYLCDCKQLLLTSDNLNPSCELLSKFVSLWSPTTIMIKSLIL